MSGETAKDFLSRMTVKLGTTQAQLRTAILAERDVATGVESAPVFITGTSPLIKTLKCKNTTGVVGSSKPTVKTFLSTSDSVEAQQFLDSASRKSDQVKEKLISWASDFFALQLGLQDAVEFSAHTIPSDIGVETAFSTAKSKIETSMLHRLVRDMSIDTLSCDEEFLRMISSPNGSPNQSAVSSVIERFEKLARAAKASGGNK